MSGSMTITDSVPGIAGQGYRHYARKGSLARQRGERCYPSSSMSMWRHSPFSTAGTVAFCCRLVDP